MNKKAIIAIVIAAIVVVAGVVVITSGFLKGDEHTTDYTLMIADNCVFAINNFVNCKNRVLRN